MPGVIANFFTTIVNQLSLLFREVKYSDVLDVIIMAFLIYELILIVRNTRAAQLAKGIVVLLLSYALSAMLGLKTLSFVLQAIMSFGIVVLAVIFQPELRRAIEQVGGVNTLFARFLRQSGPTGQTRTMWEKGIVAVCDAAERMAEEKTGALIAIERRSNLVEIIRTGTPLHADLNIETLTTIFYEGTPLHDGAVVLRDGRIEAAGCFLPLSNNLAVSKDLGTRHRSALGLSESCDAIVVVVSEETGIISLAKSGVLIRRLERQNLFNLLESEIIPPEVQKEKRRLLRRKPAAGEENNEGPQS